MIQTAIRRFLTLVGGLLTGACCTSLPDAPSVQDTLVLPDGTTNISVVLHDWHDPRRQRDVPVKIYQPAAASAATVIVSHGIGEDRDSYEYLGRALAEHGFKAVHITHAGTDRQTLERGYLHLYRATKDRQNWINRVLDVTFVLNQLRTAEPVAVVGHSAGAFTAFAIAGMRSNEGDTLRDPRVKVIVPISMPRLDGVVAPGGYAAIEVPVLNITGTCDSSLIYRTFPRHRRIPFEQSRGQHLVTIDGATHETFSNRYDRLHPVVTDLVIAFLQAHLSADETGRRWFDVAGKKRVREADVVVETKTMR